MKKEHSKIINLIFTYLEQNPDQRFGQALFNLGINEFNANDDAFQLRDIYNDDDNQIIKRIENKLNWFDFQKKVNFKIQQKKETLIGMTVNEMLYATDLMSDFNFYKKKNIQYARFILERLNVDQNSIQKILE